MKGTLTNPHGVDYGAEQKLRVHGPFGPVEPPKATRGLAPHLKFAEQLGALLAIGDVITESPSIGSSGVESLDILEVVAASKHTLYTVSARTVKNYVKTYDLGQITDAEAAEIIYKTGVTNPDSLQVWRYRKPEEKLQRDHTSVRPYDKRGYRDPAVDEFMTQLPPFATLPADLRTLLSNKKANPDYNRSKSLPFAMALTESSVHDRDSFEKVIGLYGHGYPSFYRRATVVLMQANAKRIAGARLNADVSPAARKEAWRVTRRQLRKLYSLAKSTTNPA